MIIGGYVVKSLERIRQSIVENSIVRKGKVNRCREKFP
jgi:hypothetical protein